MEQSFLSKADSFSIDKEMPCFY